VKSLWLVKTEVSLNFPFWDRCLAARTEEIARMSFAEDDGTGASKVQNSKSCCLAFTTIILRTQRLDIGEQHRNTRLAERHRFLEIWLA